MHAITNGPEAKKPIVQDATKEEFTLPIRYWTGITICAHNIKKLPESVNVVRKLDGKYDFIDRYVDDVLILHRIMASQSIAERSKPEPNLMLLIQGSLCY
ncbi:hypothetical protein KP509_22G066500 [Ceratopteris richardii]|uniref:Uncharacterized protein n=1 Tax=Ceratopteris richardii TaxID=49495 RepID=A0A8T2S982_CERRI|nr:hypothetical protein KP509_22G066500 [Ceratopteris richardii]